MVRCCQRIRGFLKGPNDEQPLIGIYPFYPLMCIIRMVQFIFALSKFYVTTGTVPYFDIFSSLIFDFTIELISWSTYMASYFFLFAVTTLTQIASILTHPLALLLMDYDRGPASRTTLRNTHHIESSIILAFDSRLMVLSGYLC
jgi:hypothetical protein